MGVSSPAPARPNSTSKQKGRQFLADEKTKTAALTKERDDAFRIAKGGSAWRRVTRAARWFLIGAAAGAIVAKNSLMPIAANRKFMAH